MRRSLVRLLLVVAVLDTYFYITKMPKLQDINMYIQGDGPLSHDHPQPRKAGRVYPHEPPMLRRGRDLLARCANRPETTLNVTATLHKIQTIIANDAYKLLVCTIPKVGSSNIARMLINIEKTHKFKTPVTSKISSMAVNIFYYRKRGMRNNNREEKIYRLRNYKSLIVVREPFERLVSAYNSKIKEAREPVFRRLVRNMTNMREIPSHDAVTFAEFISYILRQKPSTFIMHWARYTDLCHPCIIKYDYVGRYETIDEDLAFLVHHIGADNITRFPKRSELYRNNRSSKYLEQYYKTVPKDHLLKLRAIYAEDFALFNYKLPEALSKLLQF